MAQKSGWNQPVKWRPANCFIIGDLGGWLKPEFWT
jgi:hypothetical protein